MFKPITTALLLSALMTAGVVAQQYTMAGGAAVGRITISGGSTLRDWSCDVSRFDATVRSPVAGEALTLPSGRERATFLVPVNGIDCRNRTMNSHLREALHGERHPEIRFELTGYTLGAGSTLSALGNLTIAGRTTPVAVEAAWSMSGANLRVQGSRTLRMTELGVQPPTLMLGTLKVHDEITIAFDLVIQQDAVTLAANHAAGGR